jgi:hypothetical protein
MVYGGIGQSALTSCPAVAAPHVPLIVVCLVSPAGFIAAFALPLAFIKTGLGLR